MTSPLLARIATEHAAALEAQSPNASARTHRRQAMARLLERGLPTTRDENWRYANLRALEKANFTPVTKAADVQIELPPVIEGFTRFVFIDGLFAPSLSATPGSGAGEAMSRLQGGLAGHDLPFELLNEAFASDGADINLPAGESLDIEILFCSTSPAAAYPRLRVRAAANSRLRLVERHLGVAAVAQFINSVADLELSDGALCQHYRLQETANTANWSDTLHARVCRDASYRLHLLQLGALAARASAQIELAGAAAHARVDVVSLADAQQVHDTMIVVDHQQPHTRTEESFRGIAGGRARVAFNGMIFVRDGARHADSAQSLKGLIAGNDAEIDLRPQLEIHTDEVRCSHGATTGKLDEAMLFYLLSRGIEPAVAQRLLKWAFITDVVARIDIPSLRTHAQRSLASHMQDARSLEELLS